MLYFAYGSNLDEGQIKFRCPGSVPKFIAKLNDYKLTFNKFSDCWKGGVADVVYQPGSVVYGYVYDLTEKDFESLDIHEKGYQKILKTVCVDNKEENVFLYEVINKKEYMAPVENYLSLIIESAKKYNFPIEYIKFLENFRNIETSGDFV